MYMYMHMHMTKPPNDVYWEIIIFHISTYYFQTRHFHFSKNLRGGGFVFNKKKFRLELQVALTHQNRSYRDSETKENIDDSERKQRGGNDRKRKNMYNYVISLLTYFVGLINIPLHICAMHIINSRAVACGGACGAVFPSHQNFRNF